jgi:hypothetical protein
MACLWSSTECELLYYYLWNNRKNTRTLDLSIGEIASEMTKEVTYLYTLNDPSLDLPAVPRVYTARSIRSKLERLQYEKVARSPLAPRNPERRGKNGQDVMGEHFLPQNSGTNLNPKIVHTTYHSLESSLLNSPFVPDDNPEQQDRTSRDLLSEIDRNGHESKQVEAPLKVSQSSDPRALNPEQALTLANLTREFEADVVVHNGSTDTSAETPVEIWEPLPSDIDWLLECYRSYG